METHGNLIISGGLSKTDIFNYLEMYKFQIWACDTSYEKGQRAHAKSYQIKGDMITWLPW